MDNKGFDWGNVALAIGGLALFYAMRQYAMKKFASMESANGSQAQASFAPSTTTLPSPPAAYTIPQQIVNKLIENTQTRSTTTTTPSILKPSTVLNADIPVSQVNTVMPPVTKTYSYVPKPRIEEMTFFQGLR